MAIARMELTEGMQLCRTRPAEEPVPGIRSEAHDAGKSGIDVAKLHGSNEPGNIPAEGAYRGIACSIRLHGNDKKDRRSRKRPKNWLRNWSGVWCVRHGHPAGLNLLCLCFICYSLLPDAHD